MVMTETLRYAIRRKFANALQKRATEGEGVTAEELTRLMLRLLKERMGNPALPWNSDMDKPEEYVAVDLLERAEYMTPDGWITLAGIAYYRQETRRFRWVRDNLFALFVFVVALCTIATTTTAIVVAFLP